jgi:hypothetical protein
LSTANLLFLWRDPECCNQFHSGVSLHSHTMYSRESLAFIPQYVRDIPMVAQALRRQEQRYQTMTELLDYNRGHRTPPLPPSEAFEVETRKLRRTRIVGLLTDHDNIEAAHSRRWSRIGQYLSRSSGGCDRRCTCILVYTICRVSTLRLFSKIWLHA